MDATSSGRDPRSLLARVKVGDYVSWTARGRGSKIKRTGKVLCLVPPFSDPMLKIDELMRSSEIFSRRTVGTCAPRRTSGFIVGVPDKKRVALYFPRVDELVTVSIDGHLFNVRED